MESSKVVKPIAVLEDDELDTELFKVALKKIKDQLKISTESFIFYSNMDDLLIDTKTKSFNLIIADLNIRGETSLELIKKIKINKKTQHIPIVIISNSSYERDIENAYASKVDDFITKPQDFNMFKKFIIRIVEVYIQ